MRNLWRVGVWSLVLAGWASGGEAEPPPAASGLDSKLAFERLKGLAGEWTGTVVAKDGPPAQVRFELISAKTAVMETQFPGTEHEMRSVYHLDGTALVLTHYCAMGNQPRMKLAMASKPNELVFDFAGGANLDPAKDAHVHSGRMVLLDDDHLEAEWTGYQGGKPGGVHRFFLARKR